MGRATTTFYGSLEVKKNPNGSGDGAIHAEGGVIAGGTQGVTQDIVLGATTLHVKGGIIVGTTP